MAKYEVLTVRRLYSERGALLRTQVITLHGQHTSKVRARRHAVQIAADARHSNPYAGPLAVTGSAKSGYSYGWGSAPSNMHDHFEIVVIGG